MIVGISGAELTEIILLPGITVLVIVGLIAYRIASGEKFFCFTDPRFARPNKRRWQAMRDMADRIIAGDLDVAADELQSLIDGMHTELMIYQRGRGSEGHAEDLDRLERLAELFNARGYQARIEPFDSLCDSLDRDGHADAARQMSRMIHEDTQSDMAALRAAFVEALRKIRREHWAEMSRETRKSWKESFEIISGRLSLQPRIVAGVALPAFSLFVGFAIYDGWVRHRQFEYFREHPRWLWVFAAYGLSVIALCVAVD